MYDKLSLFLQWPMVGDDFSAIAARLDNHTGKVDFGTGEAIGCQGKLDTLDVVAKPTGIWIGGSLAKYRYPSNLYSLDRKETQKALEAVGDALGVDVMDAKVNELEFGTNFVMQEPVATYLSRLGAMPRKQRIVRGSGVYYEGKSVRRKPEVVCFYDKVADSVAKGYEIPQGLESANLLRYELRLNGRLKQRFGQDITASTLYDRAFYQKMVNDYKVAFESIKKQAQRQTDIDGVKTPRDAFGVLMSRLLIKNPMEAQLFLEELKAANVWDDPKSYTRLKKMMAEAMDRRGDAEDDGLIQELNDEVLNNIGNYL